MMEFKLQNNCLLKKTKDKIEISIFKEIINKFGISGKCFLIVDNRGSHYISNFLSLTEVLSSGIVSIESLYLRRKPYKSYSAIYIISGCESSIKKVIEDFKSEKKRLYKFCHIFVLDEINQNLLDLMISKNFLKHIKTLKQILIKFIAIDKNIFSFGKDENFNSIYNLYVKNEEINNMNSLRLISLCQILNNYPNIVYFKHDENCKFIAEKVNDELKEYFSKNKKFKKEGILLITSRLIDLVAPFQYDLIYQNLLLDMFKKKDENNYNKILIKTKDVNKELILDYKDPLYYQYKNMHINDIFQNINNDFEEFKKSDIGKLHALKNENNNIDLNTAFKNMPKYKYYMKLYSNHINLTSEIRKIINKRKIYQLLELQKIIISKMDDNGKKCTENDLISLIKININEFTKKDLFRIICLIKYYYTEININDLFTILENNNIKFNPIEKKVINTFDKGKCLINLEIMEELDRSILSYREKNNYEDNEINYQKDKSYFYTKECKLTTLCDMCCKNKLPKDLFTFVEKPDNIKTQNRIKTKFDMFKDSQEEEQDSNNKQNLILFNIGGLSNYEISSLEKGSYLKQYDYNLILGANKIYNYQEYYDEIKSYLEGNNQIFRNKEEMPEEIKETIEKNKKGDKNENEQQNVDVKNMEYPNYIESEEKFKKSNKIENSLDNDTNF